MRRFLANPLVCHNNQFNTVAMGSDCSAIMPTRALHNVTSLRLKGQNSEAEVHKSNKLDVCAFIALIYIQCDILGVEKNYTQ